MRVVIDTNVMVSAVLGGSVGAVLDHRRLGCLFFSRSTRPKNPVPESRSHKSGIFACGDLRRGSINTDRPAENSEYVRRFSALGRATWRVGTCLP